MNPKFFESPARFRVWLKANHLKCTELWVGFRKKHTGLPSITWPESVDQALCFGWIDGVRKSLDDSSYMIRFTPRRAGSTWSQINIRRARSLERLGLMQASGRKAFESRDAVQTMRYSFERERAKLPIALERMLKANKLAWSFFQTQPPSYRRTATWWVMTAKREETRVRRLSTLIEDSAAGRRVKSVAITQPQATVGH